MSNTTVVFAPTTVLSRRDVESKYAKLHSLRQKQSKHGYPSLETAINAGFVLPGIGATISFAAYMTNASIALTVLGLVVPVLVALYVFRSPLTFKQYFVWRNLEKELKDVMSFKREQLAYEDKCEFDRLASLAAHKEINSYPYREWWNFTQERVLQSRVSMCK